MPHNSSIIDTLKHIKVVNSTAAGTSTINGTGVDMTGFRGVVFVCSLGAVTTTGVATLNAAQSADDVTYNDLEGTAVAAAANSDNKTLIVDIWKPIDRYVRPVVVRTVANSAVDSVVAMLYAPVNIPTTADSNNAGREAHNSPAEGTA